MKNICLYIAIAILSLILSYNSVYAQIECPTYEGYSWSNSTQFMYGMGRYGFQGGVNVQYGTGSSNEFSIKIDWPSLVNTSDFMSDEVLKNLLWEEAAKSVVDGYQAPWEGDITVYYVTECKVEQKVAIDIEIENEFMDCDEGGGTQTLNWYTWLDAQTGITHRLYNETKLVTCGYKCCARIYHVEVEYNSVDEEWQAIINDPPTIITVSDCDPIKVFYDCVTGDPVPCTGGCGE
jgi:hypothetical protein